MRWHATSCTNRLICLSSQALCEDVELGGVCDYASPVEIFRTSQVLTANCNNQRSQKALLFWCYGVDWEPGVGRVRWRLSGKASSESNAGRSRPALPISVGLKTGRCHNDT